MKFASNVNVTGNTIINPVSAVADNSGDTSLPLDSGSGIYLDIVQESVEVSGNLIVGADLQNVPQVHFSGRVLVFDASDERQVLAKK